MSWSLPPALVMEVDLKVMVGNLATSKKSGDLRCSSRLGSVVLTEVASMVASTDDLVMSASLS